MSDATDDKKEPGPATGMPGGVVDDAGPAAQATNDQAAHPAGHSSDTDQRPRGEGASAEGEEQARRDLLDSCDDLEVRLFYRSEAGLFSAPVEIERDSVIDEIRTARSVAGSGDLTQARVHLLRANGLLHDALGQRGRLWSAIHVHAAHIYLYYVALLCLLVWVGFTERDDVQAFARATVWGLPVSMGALGMLGGLTRGLFWLPQKIETRSFRTQFATIYLIGPWLAAALGLMASVLLDAGLLALVGDVDTATAGSDAQGSAGTADQAGPAAEASAGTGTDDDEGESTNNGATPGNAQVLAAHRASLPPGYVAMALLAGFSWEWFVERIRQALRKRS